MLSANYEPTISMKISSRGIIFDWYAVETMVALIKRQWKETLYQPLRVLALGKGAMIPARLLAGEAPVYYEGVTSYVGEMSGEIEHYQRGPIEYNLSPAGVAINDPDTLVVDDLWDTGQTFRWAKQQLPLATFCALMTKIPAEETFLDYFGLSFSTKAWIHFPWET